MRRSFSVLSLALLLAAPVGAAPPPDSPAQPAGQVHVGYDTYAAGLDVVRLEAGFEEQANRYRMALTYHTTGLAGLFVHGNQVNIVDGFWASGVPEPTRFFGDGFWHGTPRRTLIDYDHGQPVIRDMQPPNEVERDPVPHELQRNTIDTLSAVALLMHRVAETGRCEVTARTYDGRRLAEISARTVGEEILPSMGNSSFSGRALRCDFDGRMLAGFLHGSDAAYDGRLQHGSAWLASVVPGAPPLPVRMTFETRWFGTATMVMTDAAPGALAIPAAQ